jgi:hypothetical protein
VVGEAQGHPTRQMIVAPTTDQTTIIAGEVERLLLGGPPRHDERTVAHTAFPGDLLPPNGDDGPDGVGAYKVPRDVAQHILWAT